MFGFGKKAASEQPMVCIDCGYVYKGDFNSLPASYRCPTCGVGKNRFKPAMTPSIGVAPPNNYPNFNTPGVLAQKRKNKEAFRKKRAATRRNKSLRDAAKEKLMEQQYRMDQEKRGGGGWFSR